jgi:hypothetical protein
MPTPNSGESEQDFVARCMKYSDMQKYDPKQRAAICYSKFREESMHPDFERILTLFLKRYGAEAKDKFVNFVRRNGLNILKAYDPTVQFKESFEWVEPLIQPYKNDTEAKYYLVRALTANISQNNNDYSDFANMQNAASSLSWRPVNINHDHNRWLPYPRTRVDFSNANELSIEATLRVDNQDAWLQKLLDSGDILHPSIEGRPNIIGGYHFTGMALLERGVALPGDPLTEILPLAFNESVSHINEFLFVLKPQTEADKQRQYVEDVLAGRKKLPDGYFLVDLSREANEKVLVDKHSLDVALHAQKKLYDALKKMKEIKKPYYNKKGYIQT